MNALRNLTKEDRIMVLAPHPDDETLAAGGLLQKTAGAGAAIRVVFVTDGDNNPWPQRVVEHRWRITAPDRARWGARRRREAYAALACLGVSADSARFLGYTDQGLSDLLLSGDEEILNTLAAEVAQWRPTLVVTPSALDLHPDHNALAVLLRFAFARLDPEPRGFTEICYLVHGNQPGLGDLDWLYLPLRPVEQARKREAIHCHTSQLVLSRKRFLAFAQEGERFLVPPSPAACDGHHPVRRAIVTGSVLRLETALPARSGAGVSMTFYLVTYDAAKGGIRCFAELPRKSAEVDVRDAVSGTVIAQAHFCGTRQQGEVVLPRSALFCAERVFVKLGRRFGFFDIAGWRELSVPRPDHSGVPVMMPRPAETRPHPIVCCVIPCYNVAAFCGEVVRETATYADYVIAVNDGSSDDTEKVLRYAAAEHDGRVCVLSFACNRGKGAALLAGFRYALAQRPFDVLVTLDGDRQHRPADISRLVEVWRTERATMIIGERCQFEAMPLRSRFGNTLISMLLRRLYPTSPCDTQSGFRAISRSFVEEVMQTLKDGRYETELSILMLALRQQRRVCTVPIPTVYLDGNRSSHFRPLVDSLRVSWALLAQVLIR